MQRAIRCALAQTGISVEVIVIVDGSSDNTLEVLAAYRDERLKVIVHREAHGVAAARNAGVAVASGTYLAFLDDDDVWAEDKCASQMEAIAASCCDWSFTAAVVVDKNLRPRGREPVLFDGDLADEILRHPIVPGGASTVVAKTSLVRELGGFDPSYSSVADWDLWIRLAQRSQVAAVDRPLVGYFIHAGSMAHNIQMTERDFLALAEKYESLRSERGLNLDTKGNVLYLFGCALREGDRRAAWRLGMRLVELEGWTIRRLAALAAVSVFGPRLQPFLNYRARRNMPERWRLDAEEWLAPLRHSLML